jgi:hypothetical protein
MNFRPMFRFFATVALALSPMLLAAKEPSSAKFEVKGSVLIYDTEKINGEIRNDDIHALKRSLRNHAEIKELHLNSSGGSVHAGTEMAKLVMKYRLDTYVEGECTSACVDVFLAGNRRHVARGAKIGFHQRSWAADAVQRYYRNYRESHKWDSPFEFGAWIYADTQTEIHDHMAYMIARGVEPGFVVSTLKTEASDVWYPSHEELLAAGVLRDGLPGVVAGLSDEELRAQHTSTVELRKKK